MTARERFLRQMRREPTDRCFNMEFGYWRENFEMWPMFREHGIRNNDQADEFFGFDRVATIGSPWMDPPFPEEEVRLTPGGRILRNKDGLLAEVPLDGHSTIPHFLESSIRQPSDWEEIKAARFRPDSPGRAVDVARLAAEHPDSRDYPLGISCGSMIGRIRDMLTVEGLAYAVCDHPAMVEDMVETSCQLIEDFLDRVLPHVAIDFASGWEDICYKNGPLVSVDFVAGVVVPRYRRISDKLRRHGIDLWWIDCDGDVRPLIPHFLEGGVNIMFPWEVNGSGHPGESLDRWGPELRIMGGVDKMALRSGPETTRRWLESIAPWVAKGGFIPFCDHRCPPDVSQENYLHYLDMKREMFGGALHPPAA